jgi:hypothetical protein
MRPYAPVTSSCRWDGDEICKAFGPNFRGNGSSTIEAGAVRFLSEKAGTLIAPLREILISGVVDLIKELQSG